MFYILLIKEILVKWLIITLFYIKLTAFLYICEIPIYNLIEMEYLISTHNSFNIKKVSNQTGQHFEMEVVHTRYVNVDRF